MEGLRVPFELQQGHHGVHPVRVLVRLRSQTGGHGAHGIQLPGQSGELGVVLDDEHSQLGVL